MDQFGINRAHKSEVRTSVSILQFGIIFAAVSDHSRLMKGRMAMQCSDID